ncbi:MULTISPECIES: nitrogenase cofactor biosynthesis protein NifB [Thermodesulfovibrio]|jgi:nitrogen fixation protein NifB|uniref:FeMo cofactor biosynthesis protein NifB n=1 Tax=Thermodesulfovibrio yellowstonii (strain ATCC 51303 / DSM 11347 / YP87) TaxID=289376 RepID=B5YH11_THEYD|nr:MULTISPECIES: nitrogenase cofactor biosynthesis protein NifB [Thermodesulfovibrio]ACI20612.1 nitrogen fixation protein [Thermodesulfovibrio yellowstonii DSM 11347]
MKKQSLEEGVINTHPCFSERGHERYGRLHLPVAPVCNISCNYCNRNYDCVNESRPGVSSRIITPLEALKRVLVATERDRISVIGVAGPGDPLANESTFNFFKLVRKEFPNIFLCLSTNGLLLPKKVEVLQDLGIFTVTVTINAINPSTAEKIYAWILYDGKLMKGREASEYLLENQWNGLEMLTDRGFCVKVNSVLIPGVNEREIENIAERARRLKAKVMNIIPLIPNGKMINLQKPSCQVLEDIRKVCEKHIRQIRHCRQCRADAFGSLEEDKDIELELINNALAFDYCESV